jgi:hypothetical protein
MVTFSYMFIYFYSLINDMKAVMTVNYTNSSTGASGSFMGSYQEVMEYLESIILTKVSGEERERMLNEARQATQEMQQHIKKVDEMIASGGKETAVVPLVVGAFIVGIAIGISLGIAIAKS